MNYTKACELCHETYNATHSTHWFCEDCKPWVEAKRRQARNIVRDRGSSDYKSQVPVVLWEMWQKRSENICEICYRECEEGSHGRRVRHLDHSHETGMIRGILCGYCNVMLGYAQEDESILVSAISYLRRKKAGVVPSDQSDPRP